MLKNQLLITLRNMMKNKLYLFINIFGMAMSIACCIVAYFNYDFNSSFDQNHNNASTIYRISSIREFQNELTQYGYVPIALGGAMAENVKDVDEVVRYSPGGGNFRIKEELFNTDLIYVDPAFFNVFTFEFIDGDANSMTDKTKIYINDELSIKYFGDVKTVGKSITQVLDSGKVKEFVVGGVFKKQPSNSSFYADAYTRFDNQFGNDPEYTENSWRYRCTLFAQIKDPSRVSVVATQIKPYVENNNKIREDFIMREFKVEPFMGMAVRDSYGEIPGTWTNSGSPLAAVVGIGMMGIFVLLIACFNLTNTAIAISSRRLKEIGIRKVMGGMRKDLIIQFIGETMLICFFSLIVGILLAEIALIPAFNQLWPDLKLITDYFGRPNFLIFIIGTLIFTGLLAGAYPALYISKFQPTEILKGKQKFGGTNNFTRVLLTLQFAISLIGIVCSIAFTENAKYQRDFDLGFNKEGVVFTYVGNRSACETYRNALMENPDILSTTTTEHHLYASSYNDPIKHENKEIEVDILNIGDEYIKTVGLTLVEGRDFIKDSETDRKESVIVSEAVAREFGMDDPLGKEIIWMDTVKLYVVGVVRDIYSRGLWRPMEPTMFRYNSKDKESHIVVSAPTSKIKEVNTFMEAKWKEIFPNQLYSGRYMDEEIVEANTVNNNIVKMFIFLGLIAVILTGTGLFTLVSLNIIKKMKEIGVRKVLGASVGNISKVINKEFVIILCIASVLGGFLGGWMAGMLMGSIWSYYQNATITTMIISALILFVVSALSIGFKVYNTARLNPAHVLRDE